MSGSTGERVAVVTASARSLPPLTYSIDEGMVANKPPPKSRLTPYRDWRRPMVAQTTKSVVDRLQPGSMVWDTQLIGYGVRRQRRSAFYLIRYRINGRQRFLTLGRHGAFTPDTARREATRLLGVVASGTDPARERVTPTETFGAELEKYLERKRGVLRPRTMVEVERYLRQQCKSLHSLPLTSIDRRTLALTLPEIDQPSCPLARLTPHTTLSAMFAYAIREGLT